MCETYVNVDQPHFLLFLADPLVAGFAIFFDLAGDLAAFAGLAALVFLAAFGLAGDLALAGDFGLAGDLSFDPDAFPALLALVCLAGLVAAGVVAGAGAGVVATGAGAGAGAGVLATTGAGAGVDAGLAALVLGALAGLVFEADLDDYVCRWDTFDLCAVLAICYVYSLMFLLPCYNR